MHSLTRYSVIPLLLAIALPSAVVNAESSDPTKEQAQADLRAGNAALEQGRAEEALAKFTEAYRLFASPKIHYNLGQAHGLIPGHEPQAYEEMSRFLDVALHADSELRAAAEKLRTQLRPKVGIVTVVAEPGDADLLVDDINVGKISAEWPTALAVGTHRLALTKNAVSSEVQTITVAGGDSREVKLHLAAPIAQPILQPLSPPPPPPPLFGHRTWQHKVGVGLTGLGVASLVFAIVEHVTYFGKASDFKNSGCQTNNSPYCSGLRDQFNSAQGWWVVGYIGGVVLGGAGGYLLWFAPTEMPKEGEGVAFVNSGMTINYQTRF